MLPVPKYWIRTAEVTYVALLRDINSISHTERRKMQAMQDTKEAHPTSEAYVEEPPG